MTNGRKVAGIAGRIIAGLLCVQNIIPAAAISRDAPYNEMKNAGTPTADIGQIAKQTNQQNSILERMLNVFDINYAGDGKALSYVQVVINYVLSFLAFIALIVIIYGFYMMFFREQDKGFGEAKKTVIGAAIAIGVIAISWMFVNLAFFIFARGI